MGRIIALLLIIFFFGYNFLYGQNLKLSYEVTFMPKKNDSTKITEKMNLIIDSEKGDSFFFPKKNSENASLNSMIYKKFSKKTFLEYEPVANEIYHSEYNFQPEWKLLTGTKTLYGYKCNQAQIFFGGREWTAWYAIDLPIQDGPYKFYGLPGLILEIFSKDQHYQFTVESLEQNNLETIILPKSTLLKEDHLNALKFETIKNPAANFASRLNMLKNSNLGYSVRYNNVERTSKDMEETIKKNFWDFIKNHDNPIEKGKFWTK
ncbi:GLPGLI family protein [Chryseobacterium taihuense]|uniref:GLPGLI family protein n=1 Tax=Chryseobacterium taihuense TaxID=1141221 RepID=A0ABY0QWN6_9FLAO|nr:GLPGLI family protein [Chryseobacterium taihuense]SDM03465.1 GLPGLI family protein [Chryseobacterium taihuense]